MHSGIVHHNINSRNDNEESFRTPTPLSRHTKTCRGLAFTPSRHAGNTQRVVVIASRQHKNTQRVGAHAIMDMRRARKGSSFCVSTMQSSMQMVVTTCAEHTGVVVFTFRLRQNTQRVGVHAITTPRFLHFDNAKTCRGLAFTRSWTRAEHAAVVGCTSAQRKNTQRVGVHAPFLTRRGGSRQPYPVVENISVLICFRRTTHEIHHAVHPGIARHHPSRHSSRHPSRHPSRNRKPPPLKNPPPCLRENT